MTDPGNHDGGRTDWIIPLGRVFLYLLAVFAIEAVAMIVLARLGLADSLAGALIDGTVIVTAMLVLGHLMFLRPLREEHRNLSFREARYRTVIDQAGDVVLTVDHEGRVLSADGATPLVADDITQPIAGRSLDELFAAGGQDGVLGLLRSALEWGTATGQAIVRRNDKIRRTVQLRLGTVGADPGNRVLVLVRDISLEVEQRRRLADQGSLLRSLIEAIPAPVYYKDRRMLYMGFNQHFQTYLGRPASEIIGKGVADLAPAELAMKYDAADRELFADGGSQTYEAPVKAADGTVRDVMFHKAVFRAADGSKAGIIGVMLDITERKEAERQLHFLSSHDPLTGLSNRAEFAVLLRQAVSRAQRDGNRLAVLFIDLDGFKAVNDRFGHEAGDRVLQMAAQRLGATLRQCDVAARLGGDEFTVLLEGLEDGAAASNVASKLRSALGQPYEAANGEAAITASIGIALYGEHGNDPESLLQAADAAMYAAKRRGKNRCEVGSSGHPSVA